MPAVARVGDTSSHGGAILNGSPNLNAEGRPVARVGDTLQCPSHGPQPIVSSPITGKTNQGRVLAVVGARAACGATITTGSPTLNAE